MTISPSGHSLTKSSRPSTRSETRTAVSVRCDRPHHLGLDFTSLARGSRTARHPRSPAAALRSAIAIPKPYPRQRSGTDVPRRQWGAGPRGGAPLSTTTNRDGGSLHALLTRLAGGERPSGAPCVTALASRRMCPGPHRRTMGDSETRGGYLLPGAHDQRSIQHQPTSAMAIVNLAPGRFISATRAEKAIPSAARPKMTKRLAA